MWRKLTRWVRRRSTERLKLDLRVGESSPAQDLLALPSRITTPVIVSSAELLRRRGRFFVRLRSSHGAEGVAVASERLHYLWPIATQRVLPLLVGQDLRHIERLVDEIGRHDGNYKLAGLAFWSCVAGAELAAFDLLGKTAGVSVAELLNPPGSGHTLRSEIPVYLSSLRRETTPEEEVARLEARLHETGATAIKVKIGGRMGRDDAMPGRTRRLIELARKTLGDGVTIHADANGSYGVQQATEVGRMLEDHVAYLFEEPCAWEDFEATKAVADALQRVLVAGGEQDASVEKFRWLTANRGVDVVQPDVVNNGGFVRSLRVARLAAAAGMQVSYHSARADFAAAYMLHMAAATPNLGPFQEFLDDSAGEGRIPAAARQRTRELAIKDGHIPLPLGPGLGITVDPVDLRRSRVIC
jgi:L-alanine-DL-glutamate epimerase-like enolase superfamily enzyme